MQGLLPDMDLQQGYYFVGRYPQVNLRERPAGQDQGSKVWRIWRTSCPKSTSLHLRRQATRPPRAIARNCVSKRARQAPHHRTACCHWWIKPEGPRAGASGDAGSCFLGDREDGGARVRAMGTAMESMHDASCTGWVARQGGSSGLVSCWSWTFSPSISQHAPTRARPEHLVLLDSVNCDSSRSFPSGSFILSRC